MYPLLHNDPLCYCVLSIFNLIWGGPIAMTVQLRSRLGSVAKSWLDPNRLGANFGNEPAVNAWVFNASAFSAQVFNVRRAHGS